MSYRDTKVSCATFEDIQGVDGVQHRVIAWFADLVSHCKRLVEDRPSGKVITFPATVETALSEARRCADYKKRAWDDVQELLTLLKADID